MNNLSSAFLQKYSEKYNDETILNFPRIEFSLIDEMAHNEIFKNILYGNAIKTSEAFHNLNDDVLFRGLPLLAHNVDVKAQAKMLTKMLESQEHKNTLFSNPQNYYLFLHSFKNNYLLASCIEWVVSMKNPEYIRLIEFMIAASPDGAMLRTNHKIYNEKFNYRSAHTLCYLLIKYIMDGEEICLDIFRAFQPVYLVDGCGLLNIVGASILKQSSREDRDLLRQKGLLETLLSLKAENSSHGKLVEIIDQFLGHFTEKEIKSYLDDDCNNLLINAVIRKDNLAIQYYIDNCPSLALMPNAYGENILHAAAVLTKEGKAGTQKIIILHFKKIQGLDSIDDEGRTALHFAAENLNLTFINFLIEAGANVNCYNKKGKNPLHTYIDMLYQQNLGGAYRKYSWEIIKKIIEFTKATICAQFTDDIRQYEKTLSIITLYRKIWLENLAAKCMEDTNESNLANDSQFLMMIVMVEKSIKNFLQEKLSGETQQKAQDELLAINPQQEASNFSMR